MKTTVRNERQGKRHQNGICGRSLELDTFIIRLPIRVPGYNDKNRIENEVAALSMAREALQIKFSGLVPRVFDWGSARHSQGWILQEHMSGSPLLDDFG